jgi:hypothetical protein
MTPTNTSRCATCIPACLSASERRQPVLPVYVCTRCTYVCMLAMALWWSGPCTVVRDVSRFTFHPVLMPFGACTERTVLTPVCEPRSATWRTLPNATPGPWGTDRAANNKLITMTITTSQSSKQHQANGSDKLINYCHEPCKPTKGKRYFGGCRWAACQCLS